MIFIRSHKNIVWFHNFTAVLISEHLQTSEWSCDHVFSGHNHEERWVRIRPSGDSFPNIKVKMSWFLQLIPSYKQSQMKWTHRMSRNTDPLVCFQRFLLFCSAGQSDHVSRVWQKGNFPLSLGNMSQAAIIAMATHSSIPQPLTMADARCAKRSGGVLDLLQNPPHSFNLEKRLRSANLQVRRRWRGRHNQIPWHVHGLHGIIWFVKIATSRWTELMPVIKRSGRAEKRHFLRLQEWWRLSSPWCWSWNQQSFIKSYATSRALWN